MPRKFLPIALLLLSLPTLAAEKISHVANLPVSFYGRPGLEKMPRLNYANFPQVNVRDLGAVGDGVHNDKPAFDAAVQKLGEAGGIIFIPKGRYLFPQSTEADRYSWRPSLGDKPLKNVHFVGEGDESVILNHHKPLQANVVAYGWFLGSVENCSVRDLRFSLEPYFDQRWIPGIGINQLAFSGSQDVQVINVVIDQGRMGMVFWGGGNQTWVVGCTVHNTSADGIHFANGRNVTAAYNWTENTGDDGIALVETVDAKTEASNAPRAGGNRFLYNNVVGVRWGRGLLVGGQGMVAAGNWVEGTVFPGIYTESSSMIGEDKKPLIQDVTIAGNTLVRNGLCVRPDNGIVGYEFKSALQISGLMDRTLVRDNQIFAAQNNGIAVGSPIVTKAKEILLEGNSVIGAQQYGIYAQAKDSYRIDRLALVGNKLEGNGAGETRSAGIEFSTADTSTNVAAPAQARRVPPGTPNRFALAQSSFTDETGWAEPLTAKATGPVVDVNQFGAKADGKANDLSAVLRALKSIPASGGTLYFPAGQYKLSPIPGEDQIADSQIPHHLLITDRENIHLKGSGSKSVLIFTSAAHQGLRLNNVRSASVEDLSFKLEVPATYNHNRGLMQILASEGVVLRNLQLLNAAGAGAVVDSSRNVQIEGCQVEKAQGEGLRLVASRQVTAKGNDIRQPRNHGIFVSWVGSITREPQYIRLENNTIAGSRFASGIGIASGEQIEVVGNNVSDCYMPGVLVYEHTRIFPHRHIRVAGNTVDRCGLGPASYIQGGIALFQMRNGRAKVTVENNQVTASGDAVTIFTSPAMTRLTARGNTQDGKPVGPRFESADQEKKIKTVVLE